MVRKIFIANILLVGISAFSQEVGINSPNPQAILEVISRTNDEPIFRVQNSVGKDILSIQGGGNKGGIGKLSENRGFGAYPSVLTLHNDTNRGGIKIGLPEQDNVELSTVRFSVNGGAMIGELGYRRLNNGGTIGLFGYNGHSSQLGLNKDQVVSVSAGDDEDGGYGLVSDRRIEFRSIVGTGRNKVEARTTVDEMGNWSIGSMPSGIKKERLMLSNGLEIRTPSELYTGIRHNSTSPIPRGGAGTVVFQESDNKLYGWTGKRWKQLSND